MEKVLNKRDWQSKVKGKRIRSLLVIICHNSLKNNNTIYNFINLDIMQI